MGKVLHDMLTQLAIVFLILTIGSFIQGVSGFGFGIFAMSFLPFLFSVKDSTLLVVSLSAVLAAMIAIQLRKHIKWRYLIVILSAAIIGRFIGYSILHNFGDLEILKVYLGAFLIVVVIYLLFSKPPKRGKKINNTWLPTISGLGSGITGGMFGVGGPFLVFYFIMIFHDNKYSYSANLQISFLISNIITITLHGISGDFSAKFFGYFAIGLVSVLIGSRIGIYFFTKLSQENIKRAAAVVVAIAATSLIIFG